ncbi:MAG TPA: cytidine deaminase [Vicinamibacterales bacterium]|nr:cytidine deaminase [Vicinamibacterales bacterium]
MPGSDDKGWIPDRRLRDRRAPENRRSGADRRLIDKGHADGDRRASEERRTGERRAGERRNETAWEPIALEVAAAGDADAAALVAAAIDARTRARARFSGFQVGAALETATGEVVTGCNVENATYGLTMCAERVALYKALSDGKDVFTRIAVVADTDDPTPPCGSCRQLLWEYCGDIDVILANLSEVKRRMRLSQLLPLPFDARLLE